ncbi:unnamed protein product [Phytophthora fragariaefolia]|uniref:Unnamed protein product n=1 Tax=Phytophthora fragariaefolia TaxID=1490495 RepID=A0A9W6XUU6_9STRA|nr:unnamed protein product [Phytophthora fragariaefolia]
MKTTSSILAAMAMLAVAALGAHAVSVDDDPISNHKDGKQAPRALLQKQVVDSIHRSLGHAPESPAPTRAASSNATPTPAPTKHFAPKATPAATTYTATPHPTTHHHHPKITLHPASKKPAKTRVPGSKKSAKTPVPTTVPCKHYDPGQLKRQLGGGKA